MPTYKVTSEALNARAGPGKEYEIIEVLQKGATVTLEDTTGWVLVSLPGGYVGWVANKYLQLVVTPPVGVVTNEDILRMAESQIGKPYHYGAEADGQADPKAFDCSELVQWVCQQFAVKPTFPDGAITQYEFCRQHDTIISVNKAISTLGALLFRIGGETNHVAISRGNGTTVEAKGAAYGVGIFEVAGRTWTAGAKIPGVNYL